MKAAEIQQDGKLAVLSGGAVVSIYSDNAYESSDLDFISTHSLEALAPTMERLGFRRNEGRHFEHPASRYFVEFPPGPVQIGRRTISSWRKLDHPEGSILDLTPTHCVMDRLASFFHWNDRQCLDQALLVARAHEVDLPQIREWAREEGSPPKFEEFETRLVERA